MRKKNPFRISFLSITTICCTLLCIAFFCITYSNNLTAQKKYAGDKSELVMKDFEKQLEMLENISFQIASNYEFHPYYFKIDIARELSMLETFSQYRYYSSLTKDYFIYYGGDRLYRSSGDSYDYKMYLRSVSEDEADQQRLETAINEMSNGTEFHWDGRIEAELIPVLENIYVLLPMKVSGENQKVTAIVGFILNKSVLSERFLMVSGGMKGEIALYGKNGLLYSNKPDLLLSEQDAVITVDSSDYLYRFCYLPEFNSMYDSHLTLQLFLMLTVILLIFVVANIFAERAYKPIVSMSDRYRSWYLMKEDYRENALEEIGVLIDTMHQSNREAYSKNKENQKTIRNQILQMLMEGSHSLGILASLDEEDLRLPGPYFGVISISYEESHVTKEFLDRIRDELEKISNDKTYLYAISDNEKKMIYVICSIFSEKEKDEVFETVCDVAESFTAIPNIGIGNIYPMLNNLSASWLESMDELQRKKKPQNFSFDFEEIHRISAALESGSKEIALKRFENYMQKIEENNVSLLMQKYITAEFLSEIKRLSEKYHIQLSKQNVSLLITAKSVQGFEVAVKKLIHNFFEEYSVAKSRIKDEETQKICDYIETHFAEYNLSLENIAETLGTDTAAVRQAVLNKTGKRYKDYLIYLRMEYAKELLQDETISVAEVCEKIGYGNVSHFIKIFKEIAGVTPAKYRQSIKKRD